MKNTLQRRKSNRLSDYDYSNPASYFVTICTRNRVKIFWRNDNFLSAAGEIAEQEISLLTERFSLLKVDKYIIMPDHIHLIITITDSSLKNEEKSPNLSNIIGSFKSRVSQKAGFENGIWQKSFYDHIIRNQNDYNDAWNYIDNNYKKYFLISENDF